MFGVPQEKKMEDEKENLLETFEVSRASTKDSLLLRLILSVSILFNVILILFGIFSYTHEGVSAIKSSYEDGFTSDLDYVKSEIELVEKAFNGGVSFDGEGNLVADQGGHEYIGPPSPAVDDAWEALLEGLNLDFSKDEVDLTGSTFQWPETGLYFSGLDVYHSLHCLALQCHADLTPMEWNLDGSRIILKTDTRHTCRNFEKIHVWATSHRTKFENIKSWLNGSLTIVD
ncbi:hypothetical protein Hte_003171 [Hypoxylon texense]